METFGAEGQYELSSQAFADARERCFWREVAMEITILPRDSTSIVSLCIIVGGMPDGIVRGCATSSASADPAQAAPPAPAPEPPENT